MQLGKCQGRHWLLTALYGTAVPRLAGTQALFGYCFHRSTGRIGRASRAMYQLQEPLDGDLTYSCQLRARLLAKSLAKWKLMPICFGRHCQHDFLHDAALMVLRVTFLYRFLLAVAEQEQTNTMSALILAGI